MGKIHDAILDVLAAEIRVRTKWDEAPQLYRVHLTGGAPRLVPMRLPDALWGMDRPPAVLQFLAGGMAAGQLRSPDADLHGMAFRFEGWGVIDTDPAQARRHAVLADEHKLHTLPERVEVRMMMAVDRAGITYVAELARGSAEVSSTVVFPGRPDKGISGSVADSLGLMVTTLTGIRFAPRQEPPV